jgi:HSP20 family protein
MKRAFDIFSGNGETAGKALDHWLQAERELLWKPAIELEETENEFRLRIAVPGVDPKNIDIEVTSEDILVKANLKEQRVEKKGTIHTTEFASGNLFRAVHFPRPINLDKVKAEIKNGMLRITAAIAESAEGKKVKRARAGAGS